VQDAGMASWAELEAAEPDFARRVRALLDAHKHKTMATLRKDGSPRISGTEAGFVAGELWIGSMPGAMKALDLRRDARVALHSGSVDADEDQPDSWPGDAKLSGRAVEVTDPQEKATFWATQPQKPPDHDSSHLFRIEPTEVVITRVEMPEGLIIESWHEGIGYRRRSR
jgi:hypothetical protein